MTTEREVGMPGRWEGGFKREGDVCIPMADSHYCMAETNTTLCSKKLSSSQKKGASPRDPRDVHTYKLMRTLSRLSLLWAEDVWTHRTGYLQPHELAPSS